MYNLSVQYRLAGNIFENRYYLIADTLPEAKTQASEIIDAMKGIQTSDVEYLSATVTAQADPYTSTPLESIPVNGEMVGATMPAISFLEFVYRPNEGRGKTTHRIRGSAANDYTDLGTFNVSSTGAGDFDGSSGVGTSESNYLLFDLAVRENTCNANGTRLTPSGVIRIGAKRATRRL
jgi:hypothetical protein